MSDDQQAPLAELTAQLDAQRHLIGLEQLYYERLLETDVGAERLLIGAGQPASHTLIGAPRDPYNGVAILNATGATVWWSPSPGAGAGTSPYQVPPCSWLALPVRYSDCSIAIAQADTTMPAAQVSVMRLRIPPAGLRTGRYGGQPLADTVDACDLIYQPTAGQTIISLALDPGIYRVTVTGGAGAGADPQLAVLLLDTTQVGTLFSGGRCNATDAVFERLSIPTPSTLYYNVVKAVTTEDSVFARIAATRVG